MIFDTHAHYDDNMFDADRDRLLGGELSASGIAGVMNVSSDTASVDTTNALSLQYENVYAALGIHPSDTGQLTDEDILHIEKLASENKKVRAIGEIGFDYHYDSPDRKCQEKWFARQLELAKKLDLPVIIHSRDAAKDTMDMIENFYSDRRDRINGVIHCYSYSPEDAKRYTGLGFYIGVGGVVTFKNSRRLKETVENLDLEHIVLETDCPYLAPEPYRGRRNSSLYLPFVAEALAEIKKTDREEVEKVTFDNALRLYGLK